MVLHDEILKCRFQVDYHYIEFDHHQFVTHMNDVKHEGATEEVARLTRLVAYNNSTINSLRGRNHTLRLMLDKALADFDGEEALFNALATQSLVLQRRINEVNEQATQAGVAFVLHEHHVLVAKTTYTALQVFDQFRPCWAQESGH